jgi:hypothetical protein
VLQSTTAVIADPSVAFICASPHTSLRTLPFRLCERASLETGLAEGIHGETEEIRNRFSSR